MNPIVERINELCRRKGWSAYELSKQTGIAANTVYGWTRTDSVPTLNNVIKICEAMQITVEQFFCGAQAYSLTEEENKLLQDWFLLSDLEKQSIFKMIDVFKTIKR